MTNGTAYTFSVTATNAIGSSNSSATSNSVSSTGAVIGDVREGGVVFWVDPSDNTRCLVCAHVDTPTPLTWQNAVNYCLGYTNTDTGTGIFDDWYLPSKNELQMMCANLQRFGCSTNTPGGSNPNLCTSRIVGFTDFFYWSSSEYVSSFEWGQYFDFGNQSNFSKPATYYVRAVRAF